MTEQDHEKLPVTPETEAYERGFEAGYQQGLQKRPPSRPVQIDLIGIIIVVGIMVFFIIEALK